MSFANDKSISLDWNGTQFILTSRPETGLGFDYATSFDGITWTTFTSASSALSTHSIHQTKWTGQTFQLGGNIQTTTNQPVLGHTNEDAENRILIPPTASPLPFSTTADIDINLEQPHTLTFPRPISLLLGSGGTDGKNIAYSVEDGQNWQLVAECPLSTSAMAADWNGCHWMAVGSGPHHTMAFSKDGIHWKGRGKRVFSQGRAIRWSATEHVWVAGGNGRHVLAYSSDGIFWTGIESIGDMTECHTLAYSQAQEMWVAGGLGGMAYSRNGRQWTPTTGGFDQMCRDIQWNGSFWISIGENETGTHTFALSSDGMQWTTHTNPIFDGIALTQIYSSNVKNATIVLGQDNAVYTTLYNQFSLYDRMETLFEPTAIGHHGSFFVMGGGNKTQTSIDGFYWSSAETVPFTSIHSFAWNRSNEGLLRVKPGSIAVGEGNNTMAYSADGILWKGLGNHLFPLRANSVKWNGSHWAVVGLADTESALSGYSNAWIALSHNGKDWQAQDTVAPLFTEGRDIEWNGNRWIAVGVGTTYSMAYSTDGINWHGIVLPEEYAFIGTRILWSGAYWIAIGSGTYTCLLSADGIEWTPRHYACTNSSVASVSPFTSQCSSGASTLSAVQDGTLDASTWSSDSNVYNSTSGEYEGTETTLISDESVAGEWIEFGLDSETPLLQWIAGWMNRTETIHTAYPKQIVVAGSTDGGSTWTEIDTFEWNSTVAPILDSPLYLPRAFSFLPGSLGSSASSWSSVRFVFPRIFGGSATHVEIGEIELWTRSAETPDMDIRYTPLVLPDYVLFPVARPSWISTTPYLLLNRYAPIEIYSPLPDGHISSGTIPTTGFITGSCMTETLCIASTSANQLLWMDEAHLYSDLVWQLSWNGTPLDAQLSSIHSLAYNQSRILAGGDYSITYHTLNEHTPSNWTESIHASGFMESVNAVHSNSGHGPVFIPDCVSMCTKDVVRLVGPKYYEPSSSIYFCIEFQKRIPFSNIPALAETIVNYYRGDRGPMGPTPGAPEGPTGAPGSDTVTGPDGPMGPLNTSDWSLTESGSIQTTRSVLISDADYTSVGATGTVLEIGGNARVTQVHSTTMAFPRQELTWNGTWTQVTMDYSAGPHASISMDANVSAPFLLVLTNSPDWNSQMISISLVIDYTGIPVDRFTCDSIRLGETTYPILHMGGIPTLPTTAQTYTQRISILLNSTEVWKVVSIG